MLGVEDTPTDVVCFHSQQGAEKALKAYLVRMDHDFPKMHDLLTLMGLCRSHDEEFLRIADALKFLDDYAVETRYPDDWREIPREEAARALHEAESVLGFVRGKLGDLMRRG